MNIDIKKISDDIGIDEKMFVDLVGDFLTQFGKSMGEMEEAVSASNYETMGRIAHFIKGAAGNLRINEMFELSKVIESAVKGGNDIGEIKDQVREMKDLGEQLKRIVETL